MAYLFASSAQERPPHVDSGFTWDDKVQHAFAYGTLALLTYQVAMAALSRRMARLPLMALVFAWVALYGLSDEWHQSFVAGRDASGWDLLADAVGGALVLAAIALRRAAPPARDSRR